MTLATGAVKTQRIVWPKAPTKWIENRTLYISVPFTWNLPAVRAEIEAGSLLWDSVEVGGPAVELLPHYLQGLPNVTFGKPRRDVLQKINPLATRTTTGCVNKCRFCAVGTGAVGDGRFHEYEDWPNLPCICDDNLLAASDSHFDRVIGRLVDSWGWADFQGIDCRFLTRHHAQGFREIRKPMIRMALDTWKPGIKRAWLDAFNLLREVGIARHWLRTYCLIGFEDTPAEAWERCEWVDAQGSRVMPMWYHDFTQLTPRLILPHQERLGWTHTERVKIMRHWYRRGQK